MTEKDLLVSWLNDAYSMENGIAQVLENQVGDTKDYPEVQARIQQHLDATKRHAQMVQGLVKDLGGDTSTVKTAMSDLFGKFQGWFTGPAEDETIKDALMDAAAEHFEIASYRSLIAAAQNLGFQNVVTTCQQILADEEDMARWLADNIQPLTLKVMSRTTAAANS